MPAKLKQCMEAHKKYHNYTASTAHTYGSNKILIILMWKDMQNKMSYVKLFCFC